MWNFQFTPIIVVLPIILGLEAGKNARDIVNHWWLSGVPFPGYDCAGKVEGTYPHPTKCTAYIACIEGTYAFEMQCNHNFIDGSLQHYIASSGPDPITSRCGSPLEADCSVDPIPEDPSELACNPNECKEIGHCSGYRICTKGAWKNETCSEGLFWNPKILNEFGGACDYWSNLGDDIKNKYSSDPECIPPCKWWQEESDKCSPRYHFLKPFDKENPQNVKDRTVENDCPKAPADSGRVIQPDLIWNPEKSNCDLPNNVPGCMGIWDDSR